MDERPLWQLVATLYAAVALIVVFVVALVFVVSWIAGDHPYSTLWRLSSRGSADRPWSCAGAAGASMRSSKVALCACQRTGACVAIATA
jgi:hypothetical protein